MQAKQRLQENTTKPVKFHYMNDPDNIKGINADRTYQRKNEIHYGDKFPDLKLFSVKPDAKYNINLKVNPDNIPCKFPQYQEVGKPPSRKTAIGFMNSFYGIPYHDIVIEIPAGQIAHAEGMTAEKFMQQNWQREVTSPDFFMDDPRVHEFINGGGSSATEEHSEASEDIDSEAGEVKTHPAPEVKPAFEVEKEEAKEEAKEELTEEETAELQKKVEQMEKRKKVASKLKKRKPEKPSGEAKKPDSGEIYEEEKEEELNADVKRDYNKFLEENKIDADADFTKIKKKLNKWLEDNSRDKIDGRSSNKPKTTNAWIQEFVKRKNAPPKPTTTTNTTTPSSVTMELTPLGELLKKQK